VQEEDCYCETTDFRLPSLRFAVPATVLAVTVWHIWEARNDARNNCGVVNSG
jgi:hypothetical protein